MTILLDAAGNPQPKVLVAIPSGDTVQAGFAQDLALMLAFTTHARPDMVVRFANVRGSILPRERHALAKHALENSATHILWLDSDMRFPKDTLLRLLAHDKAIVAANYVTRRPPIVPTAADLDGNYDYMLPNEPEPLVEVLRAGMGVMLTSIDVFTKIQRPWFAIGYNRNDDEYVGEDVFFCQRARAEGFAVWIDTNLSKQIAHTGSFEYVPIHAQLALAQSLKEQEAEKL